MKQTEEKQIWFFVDEAGDPTFYDRSGNLIVGQEGCSKILWSCPGFVDKLRLKKKSLRCQEHITHIRRNSSGRLLSWHGWAGVQPSWHGSLSPPLLTGIQATVLLEMAEKRSKRELWDVSKFNKNILD